ADLLDSGRSRNSPVGAVLRKRRAQTAATFYPRIEQFGGATRKAPKQKPRPAPGCWGTVRPPSVSGIVKHCSPLLRTSVVGNCPGHHRQSWHSTCPIYGN